ncbi:MAG: hypothetical protein B6U95_08020 [Thermofilum sp. ex4484_82]|nr:MAG: hypothetical protein B6U95_08020 [Thermofilum sp. ex4484_82]OYT36728.1 MAG: hypothetical protein B6U96_08020 [Archaeoglobales archaeon ex4484_92]
MKVLGVVFKGYNSGIIKFVTEIIDFLQNTGFEVYLEKKQADKVGKQELSIKSFNSKDLDALVVIGGDGTILKVFHEIARDIPLIPVNSNSLGFFYDLNRDNYQKAFKLIMEGNYYIKTFKTGSLTVDSIKISDFLNEIAIYNVKKGKMFIFKLFRNGELITGGRCDGAIIATMLGSTAYPFTQFLKPIVFSSESSLEVQNFVDSLILVDGILQYEVKKDSKMMITLSGKNISFVKIKAFERNFFAKIKRRLFDEPFTSKFF